MIWQMIFWLAAVVMFGFWVLTFLFTRQRKTGQRAIVFYVGTLVVWPALAVSFGIELAAAVHEGIDKPVGPSVVYSLLLAFTLTLLAWLAGYAIAAISGWPIRKRVTV